MDGKERIKQLLDEAAKISPAEREGFLLRECKGDDAMKREVEELLAADESSPHLADSVAFRFGNEDEIIGKILGGRYIVRKKLGKGGMGQVYLAEDKFIPTLNFAIKVFDQGFAKEVEALARVKSEHVVKIFTTGEMDDGRPFMVMELLTGQTLADLLNKPSRLSQLDIAQLMRRIGEATTELHEATTELNDEGIIHRDLKPSNIMVENRKGNWNIKLFDLGVARLKNPLMGKSTSRHIPMGTPLYMAPEQFHGQAMGSFGCQRKSLKEIISPATDVYSLGVIAYEMLTGLHPFSGAENPASVAMKQNEGRYAEALNRHHEIPVAARASVLKAMAFCPERRYQKAEEFGEQLASALTITPTVPEPTKTKYWIIAAVVLLVLIGGGLITWRILDTLPVANNNQAVANANSNSNQTRVKSNENSNVGETKPDIDGNQTDQRENREIAYWLITQQKQNEQLVGEPKIINVQDRLIGGWNIKVYVKSEERGYLYLINDGPSAKGSPVQILFPVPKRNNGISEIPPNQPIEAFSGDLGRSSGTEHLWIVWAAEKVQTLERLSKYANEIDKGKVSEQSDIEATRSFLLQFKQANAETDVQNQRVMLRGKEKVLVKELLLNHY